MTEKATFAAGCFWGVESSFAQLPGVLSTRVGYIGGRTENPSYEDICSHKTGHAEAVEVSFDPEQISYDQLLGQFWGSHDPTQLNRQGPDVGDNYRSAIFVHGDSQRVAAETSKAGEQTRHSKPIATEIVAAPTFWEAEGYHQQYFAKRGIAPTCQIY